MADILTLPQARKALGLPAADNSRDADLSETYVPAVTEIVESLAGPQSARTGVVWTADGGTPSVLLPSRVAAVTSVVENGVTLVPDDDYFVDVENGIVHRGSTLVPSVFLPGSQSVVVTYNEPTTVKKKIVLAARIILRHLWQADNQGARPDFGSNSEDLVSTPVGYLIPRRAYQALTGEDEAGFA